VETRVVGERADGETEVIGSAKKKEVNEKVSPQGMFHTGMG
jgi:hypothetical protein